MTNVFAAAPPAALVTPPWARALTADELDETVGGALEPVTLAAAIFAASVVVGIVDRLLFGGCRCRR